MNVESVTYKPLTRARRLAFDHRDSAILKALAIVAIVLHNFFHAVSPAHQNEFLFHPGGFHVFLDTVRHGSLAIQAFFSFFGHFGVQIFVFLSAYGLARSHWDGDASWGAFMLSRVKKLFPVFGVVVLPWFIATSVQTGPIAFLQKEGAEIALMFLGLSPFLPGHGLPPVGPWWFIPFILQFYALWLPLRWFTKRFGWRGLIGLALLCMAITAALNPLLSRWVINLYETPIARMPILCLGIAVARYPVRLNRWLAIAGGGALLLGSQFAVFWPLSFVGVAVLSLWMYERARGGLRRFSFLERLGEWSVLVFLVNALVRDELLPYATTPGRELVFGAANLVMSFVVAAVVHMLLFAERAGAQTAQVAAAPAD